MHWAMSVNAVWMLMTLQPCYLEGNEILGEPHPAFFWSPNQRGSFQPSINQYLLSRVAGNLNSSIVYTLETCNFKSINFLPVVPRVLKPMYCQELREIKCPRDNQITLFVFGSAMGFILESIFESNHQGVTWLWVVPPDHAVSLTSGYYPSQHKIEWMLHSKEDKLQIH